MTIKTPEQIADESLAHFGMMASWENFDGDVTAFYNAWLDRINDGTEVPDWAK